MLGFRDLFTRKKFWCAALAVGAASACIHVQQVNPLNQCKTVWGKPQILFSSTFNLGTTLSTWPGGANATSNAWLVDQSNTTAGILSLLQVNLGAVSGVVTPSFSPDGSKVVFISNMDTLAPTVTNAPAALNVWTMKSDGTALTALTVNAAGMGDSTNPSFSPDGKSIVFSSNMDLTTTFGGASIGAIATTNIWVINLTTSTLTAFTQYTGAGTGPISPVYNLAKSQIVFSSDMDLTTSSLNWIGPSAGAKNIWVMSSLDGSSLTPLTSHVAADDALSPAVSPDGKTIAYTSNTVYGESNVWTIPSTGGTETALTQYTTVTAFGAQNPRFSADSVSLTFSSDMDLAASSSNWVGAAAGARNVWIIGASGTGLQPLTASALADSVQPFFLPDSTAIVFSSLLDTTTTVGNWGLAAFLTQNLWTVTPNGSTLTPVSTNTGGTPSGTGAADASSGAAYQSATCL